MRSDADTVEEYLESLPEDRRHAIATVRDIILSNLPPGYEEVMAWGMITYQVPLETYPDTYNGEPLVYASLASQKRHMAVYLMSLYGGRERTFIEEYRASGKRVDVGKSCVRFRKLDDLPLDLLGRTIAATDVDTFVGNAKEARAAR